MSPQHEPFRCFHGNAKPYEPFWTFVNAAESSSGQTELAIDGVISEYSWMGDEITPKKFKDDLYNYGQGGPILMRLNSPGGDVIAASKMRAIMTEYPGDITVQVDGLAASAAVMLAISGKTLQMMDSAYMMIHDPAVGILMALLDIETLGKLRDNLISIKNGIVPAYAAKTGMSEDKISRLMKNETWMSANEAKDYGFVDMVLTGGQQNKATFQNMAFLNAMQTFVNVPPALLSSEAAPVEDNDLDRLNGQELREAQALRDYVHLYK